MLLWSSRIETLLEVYGNKKYQVFVHLYANVSIYSIVKSLRNVSTEYFFQETLLGIKTLATSSSTVCNVELRLSQHSFPEPTSFVVKSKNRGPWHFQLLNPDLIGGHCKWTKWGWAGTCVQAANQTKTDSGQTHFNLVSNLWTQLKTIAFCIGETPKEPLIIVYWKLARIVMTGKECKRKPCKNDIAHSTSAACYRRNIISRSSRYTDAFLNERELRIIIPDTSIYQDSNIPEGFKFCNYQEQRNCLTPG